MPPFSSVLVDVLIPAFNAERTVTQSVGSILAQTVENIRVVVIDDGSSDATGHLLQEIAARDSRVLVLTRPNGGIVDALNVGLGICNAPYIARHDADDLADPHRLERQLAYMETHPECVAVGADVRIIDEAGDVILERVRLASPDLADPHHVPSREPYLMHPFLMARREALKAVGGYRYAFHSEDTDLYWRLASVGSLHNLPEVLGAYRRHTGGVTSRSVTNGLVSAVNSQLAALSERRRRDGRTDIDFPKEALAAYGEARSLNAIVALASQQLDVTEQAYLRLAVAGKLLELSEYRLWTLPRPDLAYVRRSFAKKTPWLSRANHREIDEAFVLAAARLLSQRRVPEVLSLLPLRLYEPFLRYALKIVGNKLRRRAMRSHVAAS